MFKRIAALVLAASLLAACDQPAPTLLPGSAQPTDVATVVEPSAIAPTTTSEPSPTTLATQVSIRSPLAPPKGLIAFEAFAQKDGIFIARADGSEGRQAISGDAIFSGPVVWSPDGRAIYYLSDLGSVHGMLDVYRSEPAGQEPRRLTHDEYADSDIALSPDGTQLAYVSSRPIGPDRYQKQLMLMPADGGQAQRVIDAPVDMGTLTWSTSGTALAFTATTEGHSDCPDLFVVRFPNEFTEIGGGRCHYGTPQWQPHADGILTICQMPDPNGAIGVCLSNASSGAQSLVVNGGVDAAVWNPNGASVAFIRQLDDSTRSLCIATSDGTVQEIVVPEYPVTFVGSDLVWSPDGAYIAYTAYDDSEHMSVYVVSVDGGEAKQLPLDEFSTIGKLSWHS